MKQSRKHPWRLSIMTDCEAEKRRATYLKDQIEAFSKKKGASRQTPSKTPALSTDSHASQPDQSQNKD